MNLKQIILGGLLAASCMASAQSLYSLGVVGVTNSSVSMYIGARAWSSANDSAMVQASWTESYTGMDRTGATQTMGFSGSVRAQSDYGRLHCYTATSVTNTYYNASNPVFYNDTTGDFDPNGSPDGLTSLGFAVFNDTLQFGGSLQAGYKARYYFHVDGTNTGYGALADLAVDVDGHPGDAFFVWQDGTSSETFVTKDYDINGVTPQSLHVQFSTQVVVNTYDVDDGLNLSGVSDFSSTASLVGVEVVDANGHSVSGWTMTSGSGTVYQAVPEPGSVAAIVVGVAGLALRRRRR